MAAARSNASDVVRARKRFSAVSPLVGRPVGDRLARHQERAREWRAPRTPPSGVPPPKTGGGEEKKPPGGGKAPHPGGPPPPPGAPPPPPPGAQEKDNTPEEIRRPCVLRGGERARRGRDETGKVLEEEARERGTRCICPPDQRAMGRRSKNTSIRGADRGADDPRGGRGRTLPKAPRSPAATQPHERKWPSAAARESGSR